MTKKQKLIAAQKRSRASRKGWRNLRLRLAQKRKLTREELMDIYVNLDLQKVCVLNRARRYNRMPLFTKALEQYDGRLKYADRPQNSIKCPRCGFPSYNPNDIQNRYCANCHAFHDQLVSTGIPRNAGAEPRT